MSSVGLNLSLQHQLAQALSPAEQLLADLNQLAKDLKSGDLPAVQQDYVTLSQDLAGTDPSASASAAEAGVIVSLLSDLGSFPFSPTEVPGQLIPSAAGFDYGNPLFAQRGAPQSRASIADSETADSASSAAVSSTPQPRASNPFMPAGPADIAQPAHIIAEPAQAVESAIASSALSQRPSAPGSSVPDQESQAAATEMVVSSANNLNQMIPTLNSDALGVLPWTLFDWQLNGYRSQPIPAELLRKKKNPRGSAARTRTKRQKP